MLLTKEGLVVAWCTIASRPQNWEWPWDRDEATAIACHYDNVSGEIKNLVSYLSRKVNRKLKKSRHLDTWLVQ